MRGGERGSVNEGGRLAWTLWSVLWRGAESRLTFDAWEEEVLITHWDRECRALGDSDSIHCHLHYITATIKYKTQVPG